MPSVSDIRNVTLAKVVEVLEDDGVEVTEVSGEDDLTNLGVTSIVLAQLIMKLENEFRVSPFEDDTTIPDIRTVDDLVDAFARAAK